MASSRSASIEPRKQPLQRRASVTVEAVVEAAACVLESQGLKGYTTNAVAQRAGVSIGSLYQYFPGKDSITRALILRETTVLLESVAKIEVGGSGWRALMALAEIAVDYQLNRPVMARLLDQEERRLPIQAEEDAIRALLLEVVKRCLSAPDLCGQNLPAQAAQDVLAMMHAIIDAAGELGEVDLDDLRARVLRAVLGYVFFGGDSPSSS